MTVAVAASRLAARQEFSPSVARTLLTLGVAFAFVAGFLATGADHASHAIAQAGPDLTRLLRAMAAIKAGMAAIAVAGVLWRLGSAISFSWLAAFTIAAAAMAAGPGLIWDMAHVGLGALLLHGGLMATIVLVWRDPVVVSRLAKLVAVRRAKQAVLF